MVAGSCKKTVNEPAFGDHRLSDFVESADYESLFDNRGFHSDFGTINIQKSFVSEIQIENSIFPVLNVIFEKNNIITGSIVAIKITTSEKVIKTGHLYAIVLCDTRELDLESQTGIYRVYDANYDFYEACEIVTVNNRIANFTAFKMPDEIVNKYHFNYGISKAHPCDSSGDGDISFGECYSCLKDAISSDAVAEFLCDALDVGFLCSGSVAAACVIISSTR